MITTKSKRRIPLLYLLEGIISGAVSALSLPPFGFWILALVGTAAFYMLLQASGPKRRMMIGFGFAVGYFGISYAWVTSLVFGGWIALVIFQMIITGVASLLVPAHRPGRWGTASMFGFATVMVLADQLRWSWPFGGMPIGALSLGQAASPLGQLARIGGPILIELATFLAGACIGELALRSAGLWHDELRHPHLHPQLRRDGKIVAKASNPTRPGEPVAFNLGPIAIAIAIVIVVAIADFVAPDGGHSHSRIRIAAVQGGGARGLHAIFTDADIVFARQLSPTEQIPPMPRIDLVVWPEDVISLSEPVVNSSAGNEVARQARRLDSTLVAGVTQTVGQSKFLNEAVAWSPDGTLVGTFEKVHRVPFGEYIPFRSFFASLGPTNLVPRDAIPGRGNGTLKGTSRFPREQTATARKLGLMISFEVFFPSRARTSVSHGAQLLVVPTNDASYSTGQVPAQEVSADELRAIEEGRFLVQAAPTGYTDFVDNRGSLIIRSSLGSQQVLESQVDLLSGRTWYSHTGDLPYLAAAAVLGLTCLLISRRKEANDRH